MPLVLFDQKQAITAIITMVAGFSVMYAPQKPSISWTTDGWKKVKRETEDKSQGLFEKSSTAWHRVIKVEAGGIILEDSGFSCICTKLITEIIQFENAMQEAHNSFISNAIIFFKQQEGLFFIESN